MRIIRKASFNAGGIITDKKLVSPPIQYLFSATKIQILTSMGFSHSDLRSTSAGAELPAPSALILFPFLVL